MPKIKAILFDMDGVLIDAKDWHYEALNKALGMFGLAISRFDHLHTFDGLPTRVKLKMISEQHYLPEKLHPFINQMKQIYTQELVAMRCHPQYIHEYALSKLHAEYEYKIAVCSNSIRSTIVAMMERAALMPYIDMIVSNEDVVNAKPAPDIYLKAIRGFGLQPEECLVVEDNPKGVKAAKASGAHVLKVETVFDTNLSNILQSIARLEGGVSLG